MKRQSKATPSRSPSKETQGKAEREKLMTSEQSSASEGSSIDSENKSLSDSDDMKVGEEETKSQATSYSHTHCPLCGQKCQPQGVETVTEDDYQGDVNQSPPTVTPPEDQTLCLTEDRVKSDYSFSKKGFIKNFLRVFPYHSTVRVFSLATGETFDADKSLLKKVKNVMSSRTKLKMCPHLEQSDILIIFCPIVSRVGSDVEAAMMNIKDEKPVILVIMHHTRKENCSTQGRKWSEIYPVIMLQVHVLFHETQPGLLKCDRNDEAVDEIQNTLRHFSQR